MNPIEDDPWPNETDEQRRIRHRQTDWYLVEITVNKPGSNLRETVSVRMADNLKLAVYGYCEHKGWDPETAEITNIEHLGVEH